MRLEREVYKKLKSLGGKRKDRRKRGNGLRREDEVFRENGK